MSRPFKMAIHCIQSILLRVCAVSLLQVSSHIITTQVHINLTVFNNTLVSTS